MIPTLRLIFLWNTLLLTAFANLIFVQSSEAQVKFSVVCPQKQIGKNELLQIEFKVENGDHIETIIPPSFKQFTIVSGPNQQRGMRSINGVTNYYVSIGFSLQPPGPGTYKIGKATARVDGKEYTTQPLTVKVTNEAGSQGRNNPGGGPAFPNLGFDLPTRPTNQFDDYILKPGENPEEKIKKNLFLKLEVSKTHCFVGEPITAAFKLYTRLRSETQITEAPSFNGFSVSELEADSHNQVEEYNGRKYNVYTLRKVQLYPMQAGNLTLDPLVSDNKVTFLTAEYAQRQRSDLFFDMMKDFAEDVSPENSVIEKNITLKSGPSVIEVKPLPNENVPPDFKGAVGNFSITASLENNTITTDDAGNLHITISGQGNIQLINAPDQQWPVNIEGYEAKMKETLNKSVVPMSGSKLFIYPFTVSHPGDYTLDSIPFTFFDPATATYQTVKTNSLKLHVEKGLKKQPSLIAGQENKSGSGFFKAHISEFIYGIAGLLVIILLILILKSVRTKNIESREKAILIEDIKNESPENLPFIIPENPLIEAHDKLIAGEANEFFIALNHSLKKYLSAKFKIPLEEFSRKSLHENMDKYNVSIGTIHLINSLFEEIEVNLYSKPGQQHLQNAFEKASQVVALLDKQC